MGADPLVSIQEWVILYQPAAKADGLLLERWIQRLPIKGLEGSGQSGLQESFIPQPADSACLSDQFLMKIENLLLNQAINFASSS